MGPDPDRGFAEVFLDLWSVVVVQSLPLLALFLLISLALAAIAAWIVRLDHDGATALQAGLFVAAFAIVALAIGFSTANARTPVLGEVLPLLLAGVGALFLLGYVQARIDRKLLILGVFSFVISVLIGMTLGAENRERAARAPADATPDPNIRVEAAIDRLTLTLLAAIALEQHSASRAVGSGSAQDTTQETRQDEARDPPRQRTLTLSPIRPECDCSVTARPFLDQFCTFMCAAMALYPPPEPLPDGSGFGPRNPPVVKPFGFQYLEGLLRDQLMRQPPIRLQSQ